MATSAHPENQQRPSSSSDEGVVFVARTATVRGMSQVSGVVRTRAVFRARGAVAAVPARGGRGGRRGRPLAGAWGPVRGLVRGVGSVRASARGVPVARGVAPVGASVRGTKRSHSPSSSDEDVVFLGEVVAGAGKLILCCIV